MSSSRKLHASVLFSIIVMLSTAPAVAEEKPYEKSGFYIAATWDRAELSNRTSVTESETDGSATSLSIGYRYDANWRVEYHQTSIEFDDTRAGLPSVPVTDIEGDYQNLNILYQQEAGVWLPYFGLAYTRLDFTETHAPLDGPIFRRPGGTIETSDDGFSFLSASIIHLRTGFTCARIGPSTTVTISKTMTSSVWFSFSFLACFIFGPIGGTNAKNLRDSNLQLAGTFPAQTALKIPQLNKATLPFRHLAMTPCLRPQRQQ